MTDLDRLLEVLKLLAIPYTSYDNKIFIEEKSYQAGARLAISIRSLVDVNFDKMGNCISTSTHNVASVQFTDPATKILNNIKFLNVKE